MNVVEHERLLVADLRFAGAGPLPHRDVREARVVAERLAVRRLMLLTEVAAARLLARERVAAHELCELEEVPYAAGMLEGLVDLGAAAGDGDRLWIPLAQHADLLDGRLEP